MRDSQTKTFNTLTELLTEKESTNVATIIFYNGNLEKFKQNYEIVKSFGEHIKFLDINQITKMQEFTDHDIILLEAELTDISEFVCSLSECKTKTLYIQYLDENDIYELSDIEKKDYFEVHKEVMKEESPKNINDKINLHLKQLYSKEVNTLILYTNFDSFREIHRGLFTLLYKERNNPKAEFRFLTHIDRYKDTKTEIDNLCIAEKRDKNEIKDILEKICHDANFAHISSISFLDDNNNILTLDNRDEIQKYLSPPPVMAITIEPEEYDFEDVKPYEPPDPLQEGCTSASVSYYGQSSQPVRAIAIKPEKDDLGDVEPYEPPDPLQEGCTSASVLNYGQPSQPVRAIAIKPDPGNEDDKTKLSLDSEELTFSTTVVGKRKFTDDSHTEIVVVERRKEESKEVGHTP